MVRGACAGGRGVRRRRPSARSASRGQASGDHGRAAPAPVDGRLKEWTLRTPALRSPTGVRVLPAGYGAHPTRRYPVLYLLHGADADFRSVDTLRRRGGHQRPGAADHRHARRRCRWLVHRLVRRRPSGPATLGDLSRGPAIPWVDAQYRTVAAPRGRAIAGLSMGGFGALTYAARHPGTFAAAASFSARLSAPRPRGARATMRRRAGAPTCRSIWPAGCGRSSCSCCAPATGGPARWTAPGARGLRRLRARALPARGNLRLHQRLRALRIRHVWDDYGPGTHDWPYWRLICARRCLCYRAPRSRLLSIT